MEGVTVRDGFLFILAGCGLDKKDRFDPRCHVLARAALHGTSLLDFRVVRVMPWLDEAARILDLKRIKVRSLDGEKIKTLKNLKLEGLAFTPQGEFLIGMRQRFVDGESAILHVTDVQESFESQDSELAHVTSVDRISLKGAGVSSIKFDPPLNQYLMLWIYPGKLRTDLWLWEGPVVEPRRAYKLRDHKAEGVCRWRDRILILCDDEDPDGTKMGRYGFLQP